MTFAVVDNFYPEKNINIYQSFVYQNSLLKTFYNLYIYIYVGIKRLLPVFLDMSLYLSTADMNDNTPFFAPSSYTDHVSYYSSVGTSILTVTATDYDTGAFGTLTYTLDQVCISTDSIHFNQSFNKLYSSKNLINQLQSSK